MPPSTPDLCLCIRNSPLHDICLYLCHAVSKPIADNCASMHSFLTFFQTDLEITNVSVNNESRDLVSSPTHLAASPPRVLTSSLSHLQALSSSPQNYKNHSSSFPLSQLQQLRQFPITSSLQSIGRSSPFEVVTPTLPNHTALDRIFGSAPETDHAHPNLYLPGADS